MVRQAPKLEEICDIYIDESSQTQNRYLVLGGLIMDKTAVEGFDALFAKLRLPELPAGELKWAKVSRSKLAPYLRLADAFWAEPEFKCAHFHSLVVDTHLQDHRKYNQGDAEVGFNKEVYQLALKFGRIYTDLFHVYLDERETLHQPDELRLILNRGMAKKGDKRDWPYRRCHFRNSKACLPLQLVDIFIGAIAYHLNGHCDKLDASPARCELAQRILANAGIKKPSNGTGVTGRFTIWHRQLKKSSKMGVS